jgi:hypothetical protein
MRTGTSLNAQNSEAAMRGIRIEWSAGQDEYLVQTHKSLNARRQAEHKCTAREEGVR